MTRNIIKPSQLQTLLDVHFAAPDPREWPGVEARLREALAAEGDALAYDLLPRTPVGPLWVAASPRGLVAITFGGTEAEFLTALSRGGGLPALRSRGGVSRAVEQLRGYFAGRLTDFDLPVDWSAMGDFKRRVLRTASKVKAGRVTTYGEIARRIGQPGASRAVGQALGHNPIPIVIPCHRVLAANGALGGYTGGLHIKRRLLRLEGAL